MNIAKQMTVVVVLLVGLAASVGARTWTVNKTLPADFTTIQPALDAAAPGDTVLIGPGRWVDYQNVLLPGWPYSVRVCAYVHVDSLTIRGVSRAGTIIGPSAAPSFANLEPKGIVSNSVPFLRTENLTVENLYDGSFLSSGIFTFSAVSFKSCSQGIDVDTAQNVAITDCDFSNCTGPACILFRIDQGGAVTNCRFKSCAYGVSINTAASFQVSDCKFTGGGIGAQFVDHTTAAITNCTFSNCSSCGVSVGGSSTLSMVRVVIAGGSTNLRLSNYSHVTGDSIDLHGGTWAAVYSADAYATLHNSHILWAGGSSKLMQTDDYGFLPGVHQDMRGNYWGTADRDSIAARIWDGNDDPANSIVDFEPFSSTPLPTEKKSLGSVKGLYR